jgi:hypothetical protein
MTTSWADLQLDAHHVELLRDVAAVAPEVAAARGLRTAHVVGDLPDWAQERPWAPNAVPALIFPWIAADGRTVEQIRPDVPLMFGDETHKYLWPTGTGSILNEVIAAGPDTKTVLIVEGTKQCLAAASWAPGGVAVYGIGGCRNWSSEGLPLGDLAVAEGRQVVICLDADVSTNLDVYTAGEDLGRAVMLEGAESVRFGQIGAKGSNGLDDVLASKPADRRRDLLARVIRDATAKPASRRPAAKKRGDDRVRVTDASTAERPQIFVDGDRLSVINQLTTALLLRWNETRMFDHGGVLSMLSTTSDRGQDDAPIMLAFDKRTFTDLVQETAVTVRRSGREGDEIDYCYPEGQTMDALLSRHRRFAPLHRIARVPFVRVDGTICQSQRVRRGEPDTAGRRSPAGDARRSPRSRPPRTCPGRSSSSGRNGWSTSLPKCRATPTGPNAVALALTPFIRGLVDVVPLAVVDGIGMGSGKNLFADVALAIPATGSPLEPLNWSQEDEENRKQITSAFIDGADVFVFDEAHHLHGAALARALTSAYWKDRKLGYNQMLGFPNMVTWVSLGNNVRVEGDITRRVYRIAIRPDHPNPQDRSEDNFRQPRIREWTRDNRGEVVRALLTLIRSWYAAGQPPAPKTASFGSFERWERMVGGILHHAGFGDFLANTKTWREATSFESRYWAAHLGWLLETFGSERVFSCSQVREAAVADQNSELPEGLTDLTEKPKDYNRRLGQAYARNNERYFGGIRLMKAEQKLHNNVDGWMVVGPKTPDLGEEHHTPDDGPLPSESSENHGALGVRGGRGVTPSPFFVREKSTFNVPTMGAQKFFAREEGAAESPQLPPLPPTPRLKIRTTLGNDLDETTAVSGHGGWRALSPPLPRNRTTHR